MNQPSGVIYAPQPLWLEAVERVLETVGVSIIGKTTSAPEFVELVEALQPDLVVTDAGAASHEDDLGLVRASRNAAPETRVILLASRTDEVSIDAALHAGVAAYVFKTARPDDVAAAIRQAFEHSVYVAQPSPVPAPSTRGEPPADWSAALTQREIEILALVAQGHSNARMAGLLHVTEQTIKFHLSNIYRKLNVANRTEASRWAYSHGLAPSDVRRGG